MVILSVAYLFYWSSKKNILYIPYAIFLWSAFQIIRAGMITLTPLGFPNSYSGLAPVGDKTVFAAGAFPSGHLAYPFISYLITGSKIILIFVFIGAFALLSSRSHYSIDLIGTLLLGYCLYHISEHNLRKYFFKNEANKT